MIDDIIQILLKLEIEKGRTLYLYEIREVLTSVLNNEKGANNEDIKTNKGN